MAKYSKRHSQGSDKTKEEANKLAKANQRPGQTKEQTKLIAQGIQKGIEQYKKQQKAKSRELDKKLKSVSKIRQDIEAENEFISDTDIGTPSNQVWLPWILLATSWTFFFAYILFAQ